MNLTVKYQHYTVDCTKIINEIQRFKKFFNERTTVHQRKNLKNCTDKRTAPIKKLTEKNLPINKLHRVKNSTEERNTLIKELHRYRLKKYKFTNYTD